MGFFHCYLILILNPLFFFRAIFANGLTAIGAGQAASVCARQWGTVAPFMLALAVLVVAFILIAVVWKENYGDASLNVAQGFHGAILAVKDPRVWVRLSTT